MKIRGFSLIEIIITLGILAAVFATTIPKVFKLEQERQLDFAASQMSGFIVEARNYSIHKPEKNQTEVRPDNVDAAKPKRLAGALLTVEPPKNNYTMVAIREWSLFINDENETYVSDTEITNLKAAMNARFTNPNTATELIFNNNYPIIKAIKLPLNVMISKKDSGLYQPPADNIASTPMPVTSWGDAAYQGLYPFIVFVNATNGKPITKVYDLSSTFDDNRDSYIRLKAYDQRNVDSEGNPKSYRYIEVSVNQGGVTILNR